MNHIPLISLLGDILAVAGFPSWQFIYHLFTYTVWAIFLYVLPGLGVLAWCSKDSRLTPQEEIGLAAGLSLAIYPILLLWFQFVELPVGMVMSWLPGLVGGVYWAWQRLRRYRNRQTLASGPSLSSSWFFNTAFMVLVAALFISRFWAVQDVIVPSWGDSVHHTLIAQLIFENQGLFSSWEPYTSLQSMTYHFGLHSAIAAWMWTTGASAVTATLVVGQILNVLAVVALYALAVRLGGNRWMGLGAMLVAGFITIVPGFYVNWGRYTQLAGQVILPGLLWTLDLWWVDRPRPSRRLLVMITILTVGLALTHYRVAILAAAAGLAWLLWSLWLQRDRLQDRFLRTLWLIGVIAGAGLLLFPWIWTVVSGRLVPTFSTVATRSVDAPDVVGDLNAWRELSVYYPNWLWMGAGVLIVLGFWQRRQLIWPLLLWIGVGFLATNPFYLRLPGTGVVTNFLAVVGFYIPLALLWGWVLGVGAAWLAKRQLALRLAGVAVFLVLAGMGTVKQAQILDPFFQMVDAADLVVFDWIDGNVPADAFFAVNGFRAYDGTVMVGSDAGWWLPYYTKRQSVLPPILYSTERTPATFTKRSVRQFEIDVRASAGDPTLLAAPLCAVGITHIFLGDKGGRVGYGATPLLPEEWLSTNQAFQRLFQEGKAQVWAFDRKVCAG